MSEMDLGGRHDSPKCRGERRSGATCRNDDPFRWCFGSASISGDGRAEETSDILVDGKFGSSVHEAQIWINGSVFTLEIEASGIVSNDEYMQMVVNAVEAARREKEKQ